MKKCSKCQNFKPKKEFYKNILMIDGYSHYCKKCALMAQKKYNRTKKGLINTIFHNQIGFSKKREHKLPTYILNQLKDWLFSQQLFHELFDNWVKSGHKKELRPSIDRKDDYKGYSLDNIQLMTWGENNKKGCSDRINGINNKQSKTIEQFDINGNFIEDFYSIHQASRDTGIDYRSISNNCLGKQKTVKGYIFKYK